MAFRQYAKAVIHPVRQNGIKGTKTGQSKLESNGRTTTQIVFVNTIGSPTRKALKNTGNKILRVTTQNDQTSWRLDVGAIPNDQIKRNGRLPASRKGVRRKF